MATLENILAKVEKTSDEPGKISYAIAADELYPPMVALLASLTQPTLTDKESQKHYELELKQARRDVVAIADAQCPFEEKFLADPQRRANRAAVLEVARKWFTAELHQQHLAEHPGERMHFHLTVPREECPDCAGEGHFPTRAGNEVDCPACQSRGTIKVICNWRQ